MLNKIKQFFCKHENFDYIDSIEADELKTLAINEIAQSDGYIIIHCNKGAPTYREFNISALEAIACLEMVKLHIMNEHAP
jgi:hypothetical protein